MTSDTQDLRLWLAAKKDDTQPLWTPPWLFAESKLYICSADAIEKISITSTAEIELAIFDVMCTFWQTVALMIQTDTDIWTMARYHCNLHDSVTRSLWGAAWKGQRLEAPAILGPWLRRTLCMYQHDEDSREEFRCVKLPDSLLSFVTTAITSHNKFQQYMKPFVSCILKSVGWKSLGPRRSWDVEVIRQLCPQSEHTPSTWKGISILPIEYALRPWDTYFTHGDVQRQGDVSIHRLRKCEWLSDDIINAYVACMPLRDGVLVLHSFFAHYFMQEPQNIRSIRALMRKTLDEDQDSPLDKLLEQYHSILFPYHVKQNHWIAVSVSYAKKTITFMDSLPDHTGNLSPFIQAFKTVFALDQCWKVINAAAPKQGNTNDCGIYASQFIKFSYLQQEIPQWQQEDIDRLRNVMALEIYEGSLRWYA